MTGELSQLKLAAYGYMAVRFKFSGFENVEDLDEGDLGYRKRTPYRRSAGDTSQISEQEI
ncbi:MAG: hypothetical protein JO270_08610 [Acidobacteriaceae bacterium]|nr:hypothetical protein [Acidobacteriaceae bacterium]